VIGNFLWLPILVAAGVAGPLFWNAGFGAPLPLLAHQLVFSVLSIAGTRALARRGAGVRVSAGVSAFFQVGVCGSVGMMLAYAAAGSGRPLFDGTLLAVDRALHYDWQAYARFFVEHRTVAGIVLSAYFTMLVQPLLLILVLSMTHRIADLEKFILATFVSLLLTIGTFALFPATTAWTHLGLSDAEVGAYRYLPLSGDSWIRELLHIRGGGRNLPALGSPLIAFPSLHCASGLVYLWAGWRVRWLRPILLVINGLMLAATPVIGGHYVADLIGGAAVAAAAILVASRCYGPLAAWAEAQRARQGGGPRLAWSAPAVVRTRQAVDTARAA
jgi:membrane-associated phospholipid phosphatase